MPHITGVKAVVNALKAHERKLSAQEKPTIIVGYSAKYAVYVHENLEANHTNGQAKFLEKPARELRNTLAKIAETAFKKGASFTHSLVLAGLRLQRESMKLCPVLTGALRASAFTRNEQGPLDAAATVAEEAQAQKRVKIKEKLAKAAAKKGKP